MSSIGQIPYTADYNTYYYASNLMTLRGATSESSNIEVYVDGNRVYEGAHDGNFSISNGLMTGTRHVKLTGGQTTIEFTLIVDPTRESFPASLQ